MWRRVCLKNWDIPFYRESSASKRRAAFYEVTTAKHSAVKTVTLNREPHLPPPSPPRSANGTGARETARAITEITDDPTLANQNFAVSSSIVPSLLRFIAGKTPPISPRRWRNEAGALFAPATQGRPLADLGKANKCEARISAEW